VDFALNQNESEFRIFVLSVSFKVLAHWYSLFNKTVQILRDGGCEPICLENSQDLITSYVFDLTNTVRIPQHHTNLRRSQSLLGQFANMFVDLFCCDFQPRGRRSFVWDGTIGLTLTGSVHTTHVEGILWYEERKGGGEG